MPLIRVKNLESKFEIAARMLCLCVSFDLFLRMQVEASGGPLERNVC